MENEYKQLVGSGNSGDFVLTQQGVAEGFKNVSQFWFPKTLSYGDCIDQLEEERKNRRDIKTSWADWTFVAEGKALSLQNSDGETFVPTEYALLQAIDYCSVSSRHINQTLFDSKFIPDEEDMNQLVQLLNYRKKRHEQLKDEEERELIFRTYSDNTLRAVLSTSYGIIDNRWFLECLADLIPGGRVSHKRGDADTMYFNILLPDNVRNEEDSDYGSLLAGKNSEIGKGRLNTRPGLFRSICQNGNIWDATNGVSLGKVHKGKIILADLAMQIGENLDGQIKLLPEIMDKFLALRQYEFKKGTNITNVMAQLALDGEMNKAQAEGMINEWNEKEGRNRTAFGLINAITRMSQHFDAQTCNKFDLFGGSLIGANWDNIVSKSKVLTAAEIDKALYLSV